MKKIVLALSLSLSALFLASCEKEVEVEKIVDKTVYVNQDFDPTKGVAQFSIAHSVNGTPFEINKSFTDASGNTYKFQEIRYWVSNIEFVKASGESVKIADTYYLVENRDTLYYYGTSSGNVANMKSNPKIRENFLVGNIEPGDYTKVRFSIGVDPVYNSNFSLKSGELDVNQMSQVGSWAWQTSYIFLRTKGIYLAKGGDALSDSKKFVAETGGNDQYRTVELSLPTSIKTGTTVDIKLKVDVLDLFKGSLPAVPNFLGSKPAGWAADPNLSSYEKFINASVAEDMAKLADNAKGAFKIN